MGRFVTRRPSGSMIVALVALFISLGGNAIAAFGPFKGDKIIKTHSLSGNRLKNKTITGGQVNASTLGQVPRATHAATAGSATIAGTATSATAIGRVTYVEQDNLSNAAGMLSNTSVPCPSGTVAIGGGAEADDAPGQVIATSAPSTDGSGGYSWIVSVKNETTSDLPFDAYAICAKAVSVSGLKLH